MNNGSSTIGMKNVHAVYEATRFGVLCRKSGGVKKNAKDNVGDLET